MIQINISPVELFLSIFLISLTILVIYTILILRKSYLTIKEVQKVVEDNKESIDKTLLEIPEVTKNVKRITEEVAHGAEAFHGTVDNIAETSNTVTAKVNNSVSEGLASILHTATLGKKAFDNIKPKEDKKVVEEE